MGSWEGLWWDMQLDGQAGWTTVMLLNLPPAVDKESEWMEEQWSQQQRARERVDLGVGEGRGGRQQIVARLFQSSTVERLMPHWLLIGSKTVHNLT